MKTDLFDNRVRVNLAAFVDDYDPRIFTSFGTQCGGVEPDPGEAFHGISATNPCPAGTDLAGSTGIPGSCTTARRARTRASNWKSPRVRSTTCSSMRPWPGSTSKSGVDPTAPTGGPNFGYVNPDYDVQAALSGSVGAQYTFNIWGGALTPRVDWFYQGSRSNGAQYLTQRPENYVPGYGLVNARISFTTGDGRWNVALIADNLLDKFYWYTLAPAVDSVTGGPVDNRTGSPARGREIALSLQRNFN
jgi:iron complex outermembrane receptor protein